jgi:hypothetical protein
MGGLTNNFYGLIVPLVAAATIFAIMRNATLGRIDEASGGKLRDLNARIFDAEHSIELRKDAADS